jgi:HK97 family phage prohead protease
MNRAYSLLTVKAVEDDKRIIRGVATTPTVDRVGDIIEPLGVTFKNPLPLLWQHMADKPIGFVKFDKPTKDGITFEAELPVIEEEGALRDRIEEAWQSIKIGLVRAVSIGFKAVEYAFLDEGGIRFIKTEVFELSAVTIPANGEAIISAVKSIDAGFRKAAGVPDPEIPAAPAKAATGRDSRVVRLDAPARDRAKPYVIRSIVRTP